MTTSVTTSNPVRTDVTPAAAVEVAPTTRTRRGWAYAGIGAAVAGIGTIVTSSMVDVVYREQFAPDTTGVAKELAEKAPVMFALHSITMLGAVLMIVFAAGLFRRLRTALPEGSLTPSIATAGLVGTAVVSVLGAGLDTEFMVPLAANPEVIDDASGAMFNHWIGTIPWLWVLAGLTGLALHVAGRQGGVPRWIGRVGLVLGGLTLLLGVSPLEYMSGVTGALWLLITSIGFVAGDKLHRTGAGR